MARCWTYETSVLLDQDISNNLPSNDYYQYFGPDFQLHPPVTTTIENQNTYHYLEALKVKALENLKILEGAPSVQMHQVPPDYLISDYEEWEFMVRFYLFFFFFNRIKIKIIKIKYYKFKY